MENVFLYFGKIGGVDWLYVVEWICESFLKYFHSYFYSWRNIMDVMVFVFMQSFDISC